MVNRVSPKARCGFFNGFTKDTMVFLIPLFVSNKIIVLKILVAKY